LQIVENSSDDGEPKNSSAPPILNVMRGGDLINCAILVVRYFGGIKLGVGGLVRAYKDAAIGVVQTASLDVYEHYETIAFFCPYTDFSKIEYIFDALQLNQTEKHFGTHGVNVTASVPQSKTGQLIEKITPLVQDIKRSGIK
jgi:putative IMPACT (imprinted ancient) family translation regulator